MTMHRLGGQQEVLGIDGCPGGWLVVGRAQSRYSLEIVRSMDELKERIVHSALTLIDIPIGLLTMESPRKCDKELREKLRPYYANAVFNVPVREAVYAESYQEACSINQKISGKKISRQVWNIVPRIRQIDTLLENNRNLRVRVKECHPEWLFKLMNHNTGIPSKKNNKEGQKFRNKLLRSRDLPVDHLQRKLSEKYYKKEAKPDDLLDALVLNYSAWQVIFENKELKSFPATPEKDVKGLEAAIFYTNL